MKFGAHIIATMAVAFLIVPTLCADDTPTPADTTRKEESAHSLADPGVQAHPAGKTSLLLPAMPSGQTPAGRGLGKPSGGYGGGQGDSTPKFELFMGYSYWRALPQSIHNRMESMNGGSTSLAWNLNHGVGLVFDFAGFRVDSLKFNSAGPAFTPSRVVDVNGNAFTALFGPRLSWRDRDRLTPFIQVLAGFARTDDVQLIGCGAAIYACIPLQEETAFAMTAGGGLDYKLNHRFALRLIQAEYLLTRFKDPTSATGDKGWQGNARLSAGIVLRFGGNPPPPPPPPPNRSPVASCSTDTQMVYAGSGDISGVHVIASDPDNDPLTYSYAANGGAVDGNGPDARWNSSGAAPGTYTVNVRVDDGRGGTAVCTADIRVELRPNRPPSMSCSADRNSVMIGESVQVVATASDPDNDPLTFAWRSSGGRVRGTEPSTRFDTTGLAPGGYKVMGHVDDSHGGTADCEIAINVQQPPPPPEMVELERRLSLHSIYFQTARPTIPNPNGGLVGSQEQILEKLAIDFKRYLTFKPDAHLILSGHTDQRGTKEFNKALTDRRVERAKSYLIEHGVSADVLETRSFGFEDNLNADQVKEQIGENPELTPDDRKLMMSDLPVMVLANNRRVDVSLSTTGQQSTKRYPFNARDYLALVNTKGAGTRAQQERRAAQRKKDAQPGVTNSNTTGR
jgi:outer membrane protein OmpA-like peptidoglycan-associated protein